MSEAQVGAFVGLPEHVPMQTFKGRRSPRHRTFGKRSADDDDLRVARK